MRYNSRIWRSRVEDVFVVDGVGVVKFKEPLRQAKINKLITVLDLKFTYSLRASGRSYLLTPLTQLKKIVEVYSLDDIIDVPDVDRLINFFAGIDVGEISASMESKWRARTKRFYNKEYMFWLYDIGLLNGFEPKILYGQRVIYIDSWKKRDSSARPRFSFLFEGICGEDIHEDFLFDSIPIRIGHESAVIRSYHVLNRKFSANKIFFPQKKDLKKDTDVRDIYLYLSSNKISPILKMKQTIDVRGLAVIEPLRRVTRLIAG